jgi:hypothetical protein
VRPSAEYGLFLVAVIVRLGLLLLLSNVLRSLGLGRSRIHTRGFFENLSPFDIRIGVGDEQISAVHITLIAARQGHRQESRSAFPEAFGL